MKDVLHFATVVEQLRFAERFHRLGFGVAAVVAIAVAIDILDVAAVDFNGARDEFAERGFAAAAFADQTQTLAAH